MILYISIIVVLAYVSLLVELLFFPVPSVASTYQLGYKANESSKKTEQKGKIGAIKNWSIGKKFFLLALPATINIGVFIFPLVALFFVEKMPQLIQQNQWLLLFGILLVILGRVLTFSTALLIRNRNSQKGDDFSLKQKGIFAKSRNPILVGMHIMILGLLFVFPNVLFLLGILFYFGYMHYKVTLEEDFLQNHFGESYINYKKSIRRYI